MKKAGEFSIIAVYIVLLLRGVMRLYTVQTKQTFSRIMLEGLKLSEKPSWAEIAPWDEDTAVIRACSLFPEKYDTEKESVIRLEAEIDDVYVAEGALEGLKDEEGEDMFAYSLVTARDYKLGMFIKPVYFIAADLSPDRIAPAENNAGDIRFFETEERYYVDCVAANLGEKYDEFGLFSVRSLFESLAAAGRMTRTENGDYVIFKDEDGKIYPICRHYHK